MREPAYRVPFDVERDGAVVTIRNAGSEAVPWVRIDLDGAGVITPLAPGRLDPDQVVQVRVAGDVERSGRLRLTWMRADDDGPYVWLRGL